MKYLIISYKSRTNLMKLQQIMKMHGLNTSIISTPRSVSTSCGLSIKTDFSNLIYVKKLILELNLSDFRGIYLYESNNRHWQISQIN